MNAIGEITNRPENVVGLHFFSPANIMKLLEVVRGEKTSDEILATVMNIAKRMRKVPVLAGVCFGFIGNPMLRQYIREPLLCLIEGVSLEQIDQVMEGWGMGQLLVINFLGRRIKTV